MHRPTWQRLDLGVEILPPIEVRAEPSADGGWIMRSEQSRGRAGTIVLGVLQQTPQDYAITVGQ